MIFESKVTLPQGEYYGEIDNQSRPHGFGRMDYRDKSIYEGSWTHGSKSGNGKIQLPSHNIYVGEFKHDMKEGMGEFRYYKNRDVYVGFWHCNKKNGRGKYYFANGDYYKGHFYDDLKHGHGIKKKGNYIFIGFWHMGFKLGEFMVISMKTGEVFEVFFQDRCKGGYRRLNRPSGGANSKNIKDPNFVGEMEKEFLECVDIDSYIKNKVSELNTMVSKSEFSMEGTQKRGLSSTGIGPKKSKLGAKNQKKNNLIFEEEKVEFFDEAINSNQNTNSKEKKKNKIFKIEEIEKKDEGCMKIEEEVQNSPPQNLNKIEREKMAKYQNNNSKSGSKNQINNENSFNNTKSGNSREFSNPKPELYENEQNINNQKKSSRNGTNSFSGQIITFEDSKEIVKSGISKISPEELKKKQQSANIKYINSNRYQSISNNKRYPDFPKRSESVNQKIPKKIKIDELQAIWGKQGINKNWDKKLNESLQLPEKRVYSETKPPQQNKIEPTRYFTKEKIISIPKRGLTDSNESGNRNKKSEPPENMKVTQSKSNESPFMKEEEDILKIEEEKILEKRLDQLSNANPALIKKLHKQKKKDQLTSFSVPKFPNFTNSKNVPIGKKNYDSENVSDEKHSSQENAQKKKSSSGSRNMNTNTNTNSHTHTHSQKQSSKENNEKNKLMKMSKKIKKKNRNSSSISAERRHSMYKSLKKYIRNIGSESNINSDLVPIQGRFSCNRSYISFHNFKEDFSYQSAQIASNSVSFQKMKHLTGRNGVNRKISMQNEMKNPSSEPIDNQRDLRLIGERISSDDIPTNYAKKTDSNPISTPKNDSPNQEFIESLKNKKLNLQARKSDFFPSQSINFEKLTSHSNLINKMSFHLQNGKTTYPMIGSGRKVFREDFNRVSYSEKERKQSNQKREMKICHIDQDYKDYGEYHDVNNPKKSNEAQSFNGKSQSFYDKKNLKDARYFRKSRNFDENYSNGGLDFKIRSRESGKSKGSDPFQNEGTESK